MIFKFSHVGIVAVAGVEGITIGETITSVEQPLPQSIMSATRSPRSIRIVPSTIT